MKTCFKCRQSLPYSMFYRHSQMSDGYLGKCKECTKKDTKENRIKNRDYYREYGRLNAQSEKTKENRKKYLLTDAGKISSKRSKVKWILKNAEKRAAHLLLNSAVKSGKIKKQSCVICGEKAQAHHDDYTKPLDVIWFCPKHHAEHHRNLRKKLRENANR